LRGRGCRTAGGRGTAHLFLCRTCRADARLKAALRRLPSPAARETPLPVSEEFLRRVAFSVRVERRRHARRRTLLSLAAALLFFFLAGAGREAGSNDTLHIEDAAQLLAPSALESLLPE
jgi:hypothetical protein